MLNIGPPELILIFVIALVIVGPQRLPELGRTIGSWMRELRKMQDEVKDMVNTGMGDEFKQTTAELRRTATDLKSATDVRSALREDTPRGRPHGRVRPDTPTDVVSASDEAPVAVDIAPAPPEPEASEAPEPPAPYESDDGPVE